MEILLKEIEKIKALLQSQPVEDLFFVKNLTGDFIWLNKNAENFLGQTLSQIFMRKDIFGSGEENDQSLIRGDVLRSEYLCKTLRPIDNSYVFMNVVKTLLKQNNKPIGIFMWTHDVTGSRNDVEFLLGLVLRQLGREREYLLHSINNNATKDIAVNMKVSNSMAFRYKANIIDKLKLKDDEYDKFKALTTDYLNNFSEKNFIS